MGRGICGSDLAISCRKGIRGESVRIERMITEGMAIQTKPAVRKGAVFREIEACNRWMIFPPVETVAIAALRGGGCMTSCKFARTHPTPAEPSAEKQQQSTAR